MYSLLTKNFKSPSKMDSKSDYDFTKLKLNSEEDAKIMN